MTRRKRMDITTTQLAPGHGWRARPDHRLLVLDAGAVRVEFPEAWVVHHDDDSVKIHDKEPPDDDCVLAVSYRRWPAAGAGLTVGSLVRSALDHDSRSVAIDGPVVEETRIDIVLAWAQGRFIDPRTQREACTRLCLARKLDVQALLTFDFWASDLARWDASWTAFLATLDLAQPIDDPARGPIFS
jgi:hypothetical protein